MKRIQSLKYKEVSYWSGECSTDYHIPYQFIINPYAYEHFSSSISLNILHMYRNILHFYNL